MKNNDSVDGYRNFSILPAILKAPLTPNPYLSPPNSPNTMIKRLALIPLLLLTFHTFGQTLEDFRMNFKKATKKNFSTAQLDQLFQQYSTLLK